VGEDLKGLERDAGNEGQLEYLPSLLEEALHASYKGNIPALQTEVELQEVVQE